MIEKLHFLNQDFLWPAVILGLLLWILFIWKEWRTPLKPNFFIHVVIALLCLVSLAMIALKPMLWSNIETGRGVLLTDGFKKERLDSLKQQHKEIKVFAYKSNEPLQRKLDSVSSLFILGNGVREFDFWQLDEVPSKYLGNEVLKGIIKLKRQKELFVGDELIVSGKYSVPREKHSLLLTDTDGEVMDSVVLDNAAYSDFRLSTNVKVKGNYVFRIVEKDSSGSMVANEPLPIKVLPVKSLQVLMVNSFPTFESKYLKNFLAEAGHKLTVRNQLTRGKYKFEYFNTERNPFYSFAKNRLAEIDLLIIDANSYSNLSKKSMQTVEEVMQQNGLGVFVLPDARFFKLPSRTSNFKFSRQKNSKIELSRWPRVIWEKYPYLFDNTLRLEKIHAQNEMVLSAYRRNGKGRIGATVIQNSYNVLLNGNSEAYTKFWSEIVSGLSKRHESISTWTSSSEFVLRNEPFSFQIRTPQEDLKVIGPNGRIPMKQHPDISELWSGVTFPRDRGWNSIRLQNDSTAILEFYAMDSTNWGSLRAYKTVMKNKRHFNSHVPMNTRKKSLIFINPIWFFLVFILGMAYLWLAPKLF